MKKRMEDEFGQNRKKPFQAAIQENTVLCLTGPTAGGKSAAALALAAVLPVEIIACDSMQVYRGLDIGTAKASVAEQEAVRHHMIDVIDPGDEYNLALYCEAAAQKIEEIRQRGRLPVLVGGSILYVSTMVEGIRLDSAEIPPEWRQELYQRLDEEGEEALWLELQAADPSAAADIHPHNHKRLIRALEFLRLYPGETQAERKRRSRSQISPYSWRVFALSHARDSLYERIEKRVEQMLEEGLEDECRYLLSLRLPEASTCMQAIGYKELIPWLKGEISREEAIAQLKKASRRYAKRQLSFLRRYPWIEWVFPSDEGDAPEQIKRALLLP